LDDILLYAVTRGKEGAKLKYPLLHHLGIFFFKKLLIEKIRADHFPELDHLMKVLRFHLCTLSFSG